jgi:phosphatidylglycerophosphatase C
LKGGAYWIKILVLSPVLVAYKLGVMNGSKAKAVFFRKFFGGLNHDEVKQSAVDYWKKHETQLLRKEAVEKLQWHLENGHQIYIVSASADIWLKPIAEWLKVGLICTKMEVDGNTITGEILGENCNRAEKAKRIKSEIDLSAFSEVYAYGDTAGDQEMLALASKPFFKKF